MPARSPQRLKDVVPLRPRVLLVGINPGARSGAVGHHFAGNGNPFWRLLHAAGLTPRLLTYAEDQRLAEHGIALTNLCPRTTRTAAELTRAELVAGRAALAKKIARWRPPVVAFLGVSLYRFCFRVPQGPGPGEKPESLAGARVFVLPNPSGLNASFPGFASKLVWFRELRRFVERVAGAAQLAPGKQIPNRKRSSGPRSSTIRRATSSASETGSRATALVWLKPMR
jgi:double-stranded uracil-DNA glycosylase